MDIVGAVDVPCCGVALVVMAGIGWFGWRAGVRQVRAHYEERRGETGKCLCCGYDLRASSDRCPECGAEDRGLDLRRLAKEWPPSPIIFRTPDDGEVVTAVYSTRIHAEAELLVSQLEARGVSARVNGIEDLRKKGMDAGYLQIVVWSGDHEHAAAIVRHFRRGSPTETLSGSS